ncbi:MAG: DUF2059 domain-containing protein [Desulfocapsaceae bacterium]|nr:DUF2059 domain-containing protein [Desulfocapsaceae bacterium]
MRRRFSIILAIFFIVTTSQAAIADEAKDEAIKGLLEAMNTIDSMGLSLDTMKEKIKMNSPYLLEEIKIIMAREIDDESVQEAAKLYSQDDYGAARLYELFRYKLNLDRIVKEVMVPVYRKHYTTDEIEQLTDFYQSDIGQKTLQLNAEISRSISARTRDISQLALNQAKEELAYELQKKLAE